MQDGYWVSPLQYFCFSECCWMACFAQSISWAWVPGPLLLHAGFGPRIEVRNSKIEELEDIEKADVLVSEPMGTLLVNERMLETYLYARDHFLKPGGLMFPVRHYHILKTLQHSTSQNSESLSDSHFLHSDSMTLISCTMKLKKLHTKFFCPLETAKNEW